MTRAEAIELNNAAGCMVLAVRNYVRHMTGVHLTSANQDLTLLPPSMRTLVEDIELHRANIAKILGSILRGEEVPAYYGMSEKLRASLTS